jgi:tRNA(adenine34) deaminase
MRVALDEARRAALEGNEPYGAVVSDGDAIVARGRNLARTTSDPTAHCEMVALRNAARELGRLDLSGLTLYTTYEPCPMCCGAILASGIEEAVIAASGYGGENYGGYSAQGLLDLIGPSARLRLTAGVLRDESLAIIAEWQAREANGAATTR